MQETPGQEPIVNIRSKQREGHDANTVFKNGNGEDDERQNNLFPKSGQEKMSSENAGYKQRQAWTDPTALLGNLNADPWKLKNKPTPLKWNPREDKEDFRSLRGPNLEGINNFI